MQPPTPQAIASATGCLLGGALGDALGLPREGLPPARARRLFGPTVRPCLLGRRALVSDDTEHALMTALALAARPASPEAFAGALAAYLRRWLLLLPAGAGRATLRACLRLLIGIRPDRSGVFSAGNGPLMRAAIIGVCLADAPALPAYVAAATRLTHSDPRAERAACLVALAAAWPLSHSTPRPAPDQWLQEAVGALPETDDELRAVLRRAADPLPLDGQWPRGPGGYCYHTLLAVLHTWLHSGDDFTSALQTLIALGGDTDTGAAVLGGILGAAVGPDGLPADWLAALREWPHDQRWMRQAAAAALGAAPLPAWQSLPTLARNLVFLLLILGHGGYRLMRTGRV